MTPWNPRLEQLEARIAPDVIGHPPGAAVGQDGDFAPKQETVGKDDLVTPPGLNRPDVVDPMGGPPVTSA